jgi:DNA phosphorothioation-associated putative methyltransferase
VVNLGYVLNVVENPDERIETLRAAWELCREVIVVAAQVVVSGRGKDPVEFGDGVLTGRGTFQKFYDQGELKSYLEQHLRTEAIPAGLGIFYLFKDDGKREQFRADRFHRRPIAPRRRRSGIQMEVNWTLLEPLMAKVLDLGRLPVAEEFAEAAPILDCFGSLKRAFSLVERQTGREEWENAARRRREDLLVYLALARFRKRPPFAQLPKTLQRDVRAFFGSYAKGCVEADALLFSAGVSEAIDQACRNSRLGKLLPDSLYVHRSALDALEPLLRVYEGCARAYLGELEGANIIKLHRTSGKISYLVYPEFDREPHPSLVRSVKLSLRTREIDSLDFARSSNPPILHRKEAFLAPDHALYKKFFRLTAQEERAGLLEDAAAIGTRNAWENRLTESGFVLRGHRLLRKKDS